MLTRLHFTVERTSAGDSEQKNCSIINWRRCSRVLADSRRSTEYYCSWAVAWEYGIDAYESTNSTIIGPSKALLWLLKIWLSYTVTVRKAVDLRIIFSKRWNQNGGCDSRNLRPSKKKKKKGWWKMLLLNIIVVCHSRKHHGPITVAVRHIYCSVRRQSVCVYLFRKKGSKKKVPTRGGETTAASSSLESETVTGPSPCVQRPVRKRLLRPFTVTDRDSNVFDEYVIIFLKRVGCTLSGTTPIETLAVF